MIDENPILQLRRTFDRPDADLLRQLQDVPTGFVVDCLQGRGALDYRVKPLLPVSETLVGTAVTCACGPVDNLGVLGALDIAQPGDIIVASTDACIQAAVVGDLVLEMMKNKQLAGLITDGLVRDIEGIERVGLPVYCKGVTPNSPNRNGPATAGFPINLDTVHVCPGDVIVADRDGVVVVPRDRLPGVCQQLETVKKAEAELLAAVESGLTRPAFYAELVASGKVEELD